MLFATAGIQVDPWIPFVTALGLSFFTSMGGVSGAFLLLPFQMSFLGYTHPSVSATNQLYNMVAIPSGVYRYWREKRMVWPLTLVVVAGTLPGVFAGAFIRVAYLPDPRHFKLFAALVLLYVGWRLMGDLVKKKPGSSGRGTQEKNRQMKLRLRPVGPGRTAGTAAAVPPRVEILRFNVKELEYAFSGETFKVSVWGLFILSLVVGVVGGIYGIGGGAIIAPFFVAFFGLPVHTVAGAALMGTFITSVAGVGFYQVLAMFYTQMSVAPDWMLGILFGAGGMLGMYLGARCQKFVPAHVIKWMLSGVILFTAGKYIWDFIGN